MKAVGARSGPRVRRAFQPAVYGARLCADARVRRAAAVVVALAVAVFSCLPAWAQPGDRDTLVSHAERQHAAMMILVLVVVGMLLTIGLLWYLRQQGLLKEEKPRGPLDELQDEIARRSDEINKP